MTISFPANKFFTDTVPAGSLRRNLPSPGKASADRNFYRFSGIAVTVVLHIAVIGILWAMHYAKAPPEAAVMQVAIVPEEIRSDVPVALQLKLAQPEVPGPSAPPVIDIAAQDIAAVTTPPAVAPVGAVVPPAASAAPQTISAEDKNDYLSRLLTHLNRYKRYPASAKFARRQGVVMLHFVMDAGGHVQKAEIARSSGTPELDAEALALVHRAQPLPALSAGFGRDSLDAIVPIEFSLH